MNTIQELIYALKGSRTWEQLSRDCGGVPSPGRAQQMAAKGINAFPAVDSIEGLSQGLNVHTRHIIQACAVTLGLWDGSPASTRKQIVLPEYFSSLTDSQLKAVIGVGREFAMTNAKLTHGSHVSSVKVPSLDSNVDAAGETLTP